MKKALLFLNGTPPEKLPDISKYQLIACTDGAFHYLKNKKFPLEKLNFISGDFDSHSGKDDILYQDKFIHTPDQDKTDFHKALDIILERGFSEVDVYGGSGGEQDHYLGNLTVAYTVKDQMNIRFFDEFQEYYFVPKSIRLEGVKDKMISLYPFPTVEHLTTRGLNWELDDDTLDITSRIGTRNFATDNVVDIEFKKGGLLVFVGGKYL